MIRKGKMKKFMHSWLLVAAVLLLQGCASTTVDQFKNNQPKLDLFEYFSGETKAWGIFQLITGEVKQQFTVHIIGEVRGDELTLTEDFVYSDGNKSQRIWRIQRLGEGVYEGSAADVIGVAKGFSAGNALNWSYVLRAPYDDTTIDLTFDDWMFLQPDGVLLNKATVKKFGLTIGEVTLAFKK